ncbi:hypothetical protein, partial [Segatella buccae]|uniref:hypothetical protein n=1 Tax=Segatella buccae TaxID=28126 RepID=UPI00195524F5
KTNEKIFTQERFTLPATIYSTELTKVVKKPYTSFFHVHFSAPFYPSYLSHPSHQFPHSAKTTLQKSHS